MEPNIANRIKDFFESYKQRVYQKGDLLIRANEDPLGIFFLEKGIVRQYAVSQNGNEATLTIYKPNSFFPMMWAIKNNRNMYYFEASTFTQVRIVPKDHVLDFIKREPDVMFDLLSRLYSGVEGMLTKIEQLMAGNAYSKLISVLVLHANRFGTETGTGIGFSMTEIELASQAGISRETVSRELKQMEKKKLLHHKGKLIIIPDIHKLGQEIFS